MNETSIAVFRTFTADRTLSIGDVNVLIDGEAVDARDEDLDDDKTCNRNFLSTLIFSWKRIIEQMSLFFRRRFLFLHRMICTEYFLHDLGTLQDVLERFPILENNLNSVFFDSISHRISRLSLLEQCF